MSDKGPSLLKGRPPNNIQLLIPVMKRVALINREHVFPVAKKVFCGISRLSNISRALKELFHGSSEVLIHQDLIVERTVVKLKCIVTASGLDETALFIKRYRLLILCDDFKI